MWVGDRALRERCRDHGPFVQQHCCLDSAARRTSSELASVPQVCRRRQIALAVGGPTFVHEPYLGCERRLKPIDLSPQLLHLLTQHGVGKRRMIGPLHRIYRTR
jgi:hypothetical protein